MAQRSKSRQIALQMLYRVDINPDTTADEVRQAIAEQLEKEALRDFAWQLFSGVMENRARIDSRIVEVAENWSMDRMAPTDRNALRVGAFELLYSDTPHRVVIDEAIELARKFGDKNSTQFVNGILDRLVPPDKRSPTE